MIDIWWRGRDRNAELMLVLAHIIGQSPSWERAKIRVIRMLESEEGRKGAEEHIARILKAARVDATPMVLVRTDPELPFTKVLERVSGESDLVLLGLRVPDAEDLNEARPLYHVHAELHRLHPPGAKRRNRGHPGRATGALNGFFI